ncbi:hypothetical protein Tco_0209472 [Tanacetum coccineum]
MYKISRDVRNLDSPCSAPTKPTQARQTWSLVNDNKTRTRWGPDPQTRIDWGIPELTEDEDGDEESPNYETGDGAGMGIT